MFLTKKFKFIFLSLLIVLSFLMVAQVVFAIDTGLDKTATEGYKVSTATLYPEGGLPGMIGKIVGAALSFLGVAFFVLMIYGGYMWMFSMGNEQTAGKAKEIIIAAVIGLVIVLMAYAITSFLGTTVAPGTPAS